MSNPDYTHSFARLLKACRALLVIGIGGAGRVAARTVYLASRVVHGADNPHIGLAEVDLCQQDGRDPEQLPVTPSTPGRLVVHIVEAVDGGAIVERYGSDRSYRLWNGIDPDVIKVLPPSDHLGGCAVPQLAHTAIEFNPETMEQLAVTVGQLGDRIREPQPGWSCTGSLWVLVFASCAGAVGSNDIHVAEHLRRHFRQPFRMLSNGLLIADKGAVPRKIESLALQHAHLTLVRDIARRVPCR